MKYCLITFRSVTPAQRGETVLRRAGIDCVLARTPRHMEEQGCGYSLRLPLAQAPRAVSLLRESGIPWRKIHRKSDDGKTEEMFL